MGTEADKDAHVGALQIVLGRDMLKQSVCDGFQKQPLLRIHLQRFTGRNVKVRRSKGLDIVEKSGLGLGRLLKIPAHRASRHNRVPGRDEVVPKGGDAASVRKVAGHADDLHCLTRWLVRQRHARPRNRSASAAGEAQKVPFQRRGRRVVKRQPAGQVELQGVLQAVAELDGGERVEPRRRKRNMRILWNKVQGVRKGLGHGLVNVAGAPCC